MTHGDQFDAVVRSRSLGVLLGGFACRRLLELNRFVHWLHDLVGRPYWSLAQHVKSRFAPGKRYVERYQRATLEAAREAGVDGVVCGHIHNAEIVQLDGMIYCNDGDWVESCTALVEDQAGELSLVEVAPVGGGHCLIRDGGRVRDGGRARSGRARGSPRPAARKSNSQPAVDYLQRPRTARSPAACLRPSLS